MFVGMMANSIQDRREFKMSSGEQLREYHHTEDLMNALRALSGVWLSPIVSVSNGNPITLRSLAESVFESFGVAHLLKIGAIDSPLNEVHSMLETRTLGLADVDFREPIIGVTKYLEELFTQTQEL
jgi:nucleoside-diphosphate-sugar epimerase